MPPESGVDTNVALPQADTFYTKVFVGGLPWETTSEGLHEHFQLHGTIVEAAVILDRQTGRSKGYGFVTYSTAADAALAVVDPNPIIDGRKANCNLAAMGKKRSDGPRPKGKGKGRGDRGSAGNPRGKGGMMGQGYNNMLYVPQGNAQYQYAQMGYMPYQQHLGYHQQMVMHAQQQMQMQPMGGVQYSGAQPMYAQAPMHDPRNGPQMYGGYMPMYHASPVHGTPVYPEAIKGPAPGELDAAFPPMGESAERLAEQLAESVAYSASGVMQSLH